MNEMLNELAALLETSDKNLVISVAIKALVDQGLTVRAAYDAVLGAGAYEKMAHQVYNELQAA